MCLNSLKESLFCVVQLVFIETLRVHFNSDFVFRLIVNPKRKRKMTLATLPMTNIASESAFLTPTVGARQRNVSRATSSLSVDGFAAAPLVSFVQTITEHSLIETSLASPFPFPFSLMCQWHYAEASLGHDISIDACLSLPSLSPLALVAL